MHKLDDIDLGRLINKLKESFPDGYVGTNQGTIGEWLKKEIGDIYDEVLDLIIDLNLVWMSIFQIRMENSEAWHATVETYCWKDVDQVKLQEQCNQDWTMKITRMFG